MGKEEVKFMTFESLKHLNDWLGTNNNVVEIISIETQIRTGRRAVHYYEYHVG
jgi:hypothetical protein